MTEQLHLQNLQSLQHNADSDYLKNLLQTRQYEARRAADRLAKNAPKGPLQLVAAPEKGLAAKRVLRRTEILENDGKVLVPSDSADNPLRGLDISLGRAPIKLDIELDGYKLRDSLLWSVTDGSVTLEEFAAITCEDFELPLNTIGPAIVKSMQEQLAEYQEYLGLLRMFGGLREFRGIRGLIRLDITVDGLSVVDKFEWDLGETRNDPEFFAAAYAKELALPLQFISIVANDIHEQVYLLRRSLVQNGFHRDPETGQLSKLQDQDLSDLIAVFAATSLINRDPTRMDEFTPLVSILEPAELERMEQSRDREARRKRRQAKAKKFESLSIRSPPKTMITPLEYRGTTHRQLRLVEDNDGEPAAPSGRGRRRRA